MSKASERQFKRELEQAREIAGRTFLIYPYRLHEQMFPEQEFDVPHAIFACKLLSLLGYRALPNNSMWVKS